jgi:hypothetical protein
MKKAAGKALHAACLTYSSTLKMGVTRFSKKSVDVQQTTQHHIPEDRTLHYHCCENLKTYIIELSKYLWSFYINNCTSFGLFYFDNILIGIHYR